MADTRDRHELSKIVMSGRHRLGVSPIQSFLSKAVPIECGSADMQAIACNSAQHARQLVSNYSGRERIFEEKVMRKRGCS
jgi:hypothetical protein